MNDDLNMSIRKIDGAESSSKDLILELKEGQRTLVQFAGKLESHSRVLRTLYDETQKEIEDQNSKELRILYFSAVCLFLLTVSWIYSKQLVEWYIDLSVLRSVLGGLLILMIIRLSFLYNSQIHTLKTSKMLKKIIDDLEALK